MLSIFFKHDPADFNFLFCFVLFVLHCIMVMIDDFSDNVLIAVIFEDEVLLSYGTNFFLHLN